MKFKIVGIKLMSHATKLLERIENRMRYETEITEQFGYIPGRGTTDVIFALRNMVKKKKRLYLVFMHLEEKKHMIECRKKKYGGM